VIKKEIEIGGRKLILEVGRFAEQANAAVTCRYGGTLVLATVVSSSPREELDYFPLQVEYREKLYAGGKIKGSRWIKREGRPSDEAILTARLIDRSIRPLFPKDYKNEVQVVITVLSFDGENEPEIPSMIATSAALSISDVPWDGPVGAVRLGNRDSTFFINPTYGDLEFSEMDIVVSGIKDSIVMIEGMTREIERKTLMEGLEFAHKEIQKLVRLIEELQKETGKKKQIFKPLRVEKDLVKKVKKDVEPQLKELMKGVLGLSEIKTALIEKYATKKVSEIVEDIFKETIRKQILSKKTRADGRKPEEIRPIEIEVGLLPRTHGSAMFKRGKTQVLTVTTLGSPSLEQWIESMTGEETKRYIHHYNMPPFSLGETGRFGWPSRREIGHGALAEKALEPVIPPEEKFPYTIRVVSEILSSNGSTSMAAVCGSSLSLMDAGVPITKPVAGIAMGLIKNKDGHCVILTDITGLEDGCGFMDCKVAGTKDGITAIQMDVKSPLKLETLQDVFERADEARLFILKKIGRALSAPREKVSQYAPKVLILHVDKEKIGEVIGPGGRIIRQIISETGAAVDVSDDGTVTISGRDKDSVERASQWIDGLTREVNVGELFEGEVKRIQPFGAFVEILPGKEGLVHISKMSTQYVENPHDIVKVGQKVKVKLLEIDDLGRLNLSMVLDEKSLPPRKNDSRRPTRRPTRRPKFKRSRKY
jgi:polyribonucleotide nucleotidyltransferase